MDPRGSEMFQAYVHLVRQMFSIISSMSLKCAVQLGIPDIIHNHGKPITLPELASALHVHPSKAERVYRLMRMLVHSGFFETKKVRLHQDQGDEEGEEEAYVLTPFSKVLLKDNDIFLSPLVLAMLEPVLVTPWQFLADWMQGDKLTVFERAHGMDLWEFNEKNPEYKTLFHEAMAGDSQMMSLSLRDSKEVFESLESLVDVGGGTGTIARILSEAYPSLKCTVLDLPHVVHNLPETKNLSFVGGDMFQFIPSADAVLLRHVLHDWGDEDCINILKRCKEAISSKSEGSGKVIIIDIVINEKEDGHELTEAKLFSDMMMAAAVNGKERNEKEWERLFLEAGFSHYKIKPMLSLTSLIEVYP